MGCPVVCKSKLKMDIAMSTMEVEYSALSMVLRATIPLMEFVRYMVNGFAGTKNVVT
jgi:hypothetical protein